MFRCGLRSGGGKRDRTADLLHAMQALSQLSYTPISIDQDQRRTVLWLIFSRSASTCVFIVGVIGNVLFLLRRNVRFNDAVHHGYERTRPQTVSSDFEMFALVPKSHGKEQEHPDQHRPVTPPDVGRIAVRALNFDI